MGKTVNNNYNAHREHKKATFVLGKMLQEIAPQIGATVLLEPEWNIAGQITFKNGQRSYFRYNVLDLNPMGASEIAKDKDYANFFMNSMGYPVVPSKAFFSKDWSRAIGGSPMNINAAFHYANEIGFPVILKPNSKSQGVGISLVSNKGEFYKMAKMIFKKDRVMLVQKLAKGKDYRIVVLDDNIISVYQRIPLSVIGDGTSSIKKLLQEKQKQFVSSKRDTKINFKDIRIKLKLKRQKLNFRSIPGKNVEVFLLDNANLSQGGTSIDVSNKASPLFKDFAVSLTRDMGLRLCGVDLMIDGDIADAASNFYILEINSAPGLDHYARSGKEQEEIVKNLYIRVLEQLGKARK
jgi:D-alanine-D-alanine ligase-like ATP-grasp enzyme